MNQEGLREVSNPSEILISERDEKTSGVGIAATIEGARPLLIEIQSLVSTAVYGTPQRSATGYDTKRMNMLLAVLEKRCGFKLATKDVFYQHPYLATVAWRASDIGLSKTRFADGP